jgi:hypothetical protein
MVQKIILAWACLAIPGVVMAEVGDKEPTLLCVWSLGAAAALVCCAAACFRRWLVLVAAAFPFFWFVGFFMEIHSVDIYPALYREQSVSYYVQSYLAFALFLFGVVLGLMLDRRKRDLKRIARK